MTTLVILAIVAANIFYFGIHAIKAIYEEINDMLAKSSSEIRKPAILEIVYSAAGAVLGIIGAILCYQICAATIKNIVIPHHPVEEPIPYGISMIIVSLIFAGGFLACSSAIESLSLSRLHIQEKKGITFCLITSALLLVVYLVLKGMMILP